MTATETVDQRYYASVAGRFMTVDPTGLGAADPRNPASWNRYTYVLGDPVNFSDPWGRCAFIVATVQTYEGERNVVVDGPCGDPGLMQPNGPIPSGQPQDTGGGGLPSILRAQDARQGTKDAFDRFSNCEKLFGGKAKVDAYVDKMTFLDGRGPGKISAGGGADTSSFADYHASHLDNWANTLTDQKGSVSKKVVLWHNFFGNVAGGYPTNLLDQEVTLVHEFIHSFFNIVGSDTGITGKFGISVQGSYESDFSRAVDDWIMHDCGKNK